MPIRVSNLRLRLDEPEAELSGHLARLLGLAPEDLPPWRILRKSLDARDKDALQFVYTAEVSVGDGNLGGVDETEVVLVAGVEALAEDAPGGQILRG